MIQRTIDDSFPLSECDFLFKLPLTRTSHWTIHVRREKFRFLQRFSRIRSGGRRVWEIKGKLLTGEKKRQAISAFWISERTGELETIDGDAQLLYEYKSHFRFYVAIKFNVLTLCYFFCLFSCALFTSLSTYILSSFFLCFTLSYLFQFLFLIHSVPVLFHYICYHFHF